MALKLPHTHYRPNRLDLKHSPCRLAVSIPPFCALRRVLVAPNWRVDRLLAVEMRDTYLLKQT
jgi:hypothetical protein